MLAQKKILFFICLSVLALGMVVGCSRQNDITTIQVWHYYNGAQKIAFDELVNEFNETEGFEAGIYVEAFN